jgi:uncharacterized membrane protein YhaH (DUF805 family)
MSFPDAVRSGLQNYVNFSGRARRSEYWWFALFFMLVVIVAAVLDGILGTSPLLYFVAVLGLVLPGLSAGVRRMHDTNRSGWWIIVPVASLIFALTEGTPGDNQYGPSPKAAPPAYAG